MIRSIFLISAFLALIVSVGTAFYQNRFLLRGEENFGLRIETAEDRKVIFCGEIVTWETPATVRSSSEILEGNGIGQLKDGDIVKVYEVAEGDAVFFTKSVRGWTNNIWYRIWYEPENREGFIYSSYVKEKDKSHCLN